MVAVSTDGEPGGFVDDGINTQLRTITFSEARKGFDKGEVREFLTEVADWIEGGGGDVVRRRLERIAQKSANMLADAEDGAEGLRREAEQEARGLLDSAKAEADSYRVDAEGEAREHLREARAEATSTRESANQYASEVRTKADEYSETTRAEAKRETDELREESTQEARQTVHSAEQRADKIIAEANRQREDIETVIADLAHRRDSVMAQARKLALELDETVDGLESDIGNRRTSAASAEVEAPVEQVDEKGAADVQTLEKLRVEPPLVRNGNGNGAH
jgi:cell division septum initiation protein DivIVA